MRCKNCNKDAVGRGRYCSATCKTVYNRNKSVTDKSVTSESVTSGVTADNAIPETHEDCAGEANSDRTITDASGKKHLIDFKVRRESRLLLKSWLDGKGNGYQQALASTGFNYSIINGFYNKHGNITARGRQYLGGDCKGLEHIEPPFVSVAEMARQAS